MRIHTLQEAYERAFAELDAKPGYTVEQHGWGSTTVYTISVDGVEAQRVTVNPKGATGTDTLLDCIISQYGLDKETWPQEMCDLLNQSRTATKFISDRVEFLTLTGPHWGEARRKLEKAKQGISAQDTEEGAGKVGRHPLSDDEWKERFAEVEKVIQRYNDTRPSGTWEQACGWVGIPYSTFRDHRREMQERRKMTKK